MFGGNTAEQIRIVNHRPETISGFRGNIQSQSFVDYIHGNGLHPGLADYRHEIGIAGPARNDMHVQMSRHSRASGTAQVHSQVHGIRLKGTLDSGNSGAGKLEQFG